MDFERGRGGVALLGALSLITLLLAGCPSPQGRIDDNPELFATYPPNVQALIRSGKIAVGFDRAQVQMALGEPDLQQGGAGSEEWIWHRKEYRTVEVDKDVHQYALERKEWEDALKRGENVEEPSTTQSLRQRRTRVERVVRFYDGRVTSFEEPLDTWMGEWETTSTR